MVSSSPCVISIARTMCCRRASCMILCFHSPSCMARASLHMASRLRVCTLSRNPSLLSSVSTRRHESDRGVRCTNSCFHISLAMSSVLSFSGIPPWWRSSSIKSGVVSICAIPVFSSVEAFKARSTAGTVLTIALTTSSTVPGVMVLVSMAARGCCTRIRIGLEKKAHASSGRWLLHPCPCVRYSPRTGSRGAVATVARCFFSAHAMNRCPAHQQHIHLKRWTDIDQIPATSSCRTGSTSGSTTWAASSASGTPRRPT